jgi:hypothetical protein
MIIRKNLKVKVKKIKKSWIKKSLIEDKADGSFQSNASYVANPGISFLYS